MMKTWTFGCSGYNSSDISQFIGKKLIQLTMALIFLTEMSSAQTKAISITGNIDAIVINKFKASEIAIKVHDPARELNNEEQVIIAPLTASGTFFIKVPSNSNYTYLSFWIYNQNPDNGLSLGGLLPLNFPSAQNTDFREIYLFEKGDSIKLNLDANRKLKFSGPRSEKLNYQFAVFDYGLYKTTSKKQMELVNNGQFEQLFHFQYNLLKSEHQFRLKSLETIKLIIPAKTYDILRTNTVSFANAWFINRLHYSASAEGAVLDLQKFFDFYLKEESINQLDLRYFTESIYYPQYLFEKEWNKIKLFSKDIRGGDSFLGIYKVITEKYRGNLRDQMLLICFKQLNRYLSSELKSSVDDAISIVDDLEYKNALRTFKKSVSQAYPFELEDTNGKTHQLSDYKGKILIIDFWFTGCSWCKILTKAMHPIIERYKDNPHVVFMTICEDKDKERWKRSVALGDYTSSETINLYTNGLGDQHPMLKYYNFVGAPRQLIIDQNGFIITSSPPRPDSGILAELNKPHPDATVILSGENAKAFMEIIDENLTKKLGK